MCYVELNINSDYSSDNKHVSVLHSDESRFQNKKGTSPGPFGS
jgi:hypothetical protein